MAAPLTDAGAKASVAADMAVTAMPTPTSRLIVPANFMREPDLPGDLSGHLRVVFDYPPVTAHRNAIATIPPNLCAAVTVCSQTPAVHGLHIQRAHLLSFSQVRTPSGYGIRTPKSWSDGRDGPPCRRMSLPAHPSSPGVGRRGKRAGRGLRWPSGLSLGRCGHPRAPPATARIGARRRSTVKSGPAPCPQRVANDAADRLRTGPRPTSPTAPPWGRIRRTGRARRPGRPGRPR